MHGVPLDTEDGQQDVVGRLRAGLQVAAWAETARDWPLAAFPELERAAMEASAERGRAKVRRKPRPGPLFRSFINEA